MVDSDFQILKLTERFYFKYSDSQYPELLNKKNRPYNCMLLQTHYDYFICVPFRTNINHNNAFKFSSSKRSKVKKSGLNYSKMIIIKDLNYLESRDAVIDKAEYKETVKNIERIKAEALEYLENYIKYINGKEVMHREEFMRRYKYTTLKYFHEELL